jgi:hypothetical protein
MGTLPSGLPEHVGDDEDLARFLTQSNHFSASRVKPSAFLPNPKHRNTSVFRMRADPARLSDTWNHNNPGGRPLRGVAICQARHVRTAGLDVIASEPPPMHANIEGWPWLENDAELQKAQQLERANQIAAELSTCT